ncbi:hypothetical protein HanPSC8_Chr09g0404081 [Helianthus annuus]|nr:hypothetical protein HanPSC8_Chr09g0404081 [Helianthus annuus]
MPLMRIMFPWLAYLLSVFLHLKRHFQHLQHFLHFPTLFVASCGKLHRMSSTHSVEKQILRQYIVRTYKSAIE